MLIFTTLRRCSSAQAVFETPETGDETLKNAKK